MNVFAISDLHLSTTTDKPMDVFGDGWQNHFEKIKADWLRKVTNDDLVLLGGDMSWGSSLEEAAPDYALVAALPGQKVVIRGNHDHYWSSLSKMRRAFPTFTFVQNDCTRFENVLVCGTRGWNIPDETSDDYKEDKKIYERELIRLNLSLDEVDKQRKDGDKVIALLHYPPFDAKYDDSQVTEILEKRKVDFVLYGHLHGKSVRVTPRIEKNGIVYFLTSCDLISNKLVQVI